MLKINWMAISAITGIVVGLATITTSVVTAVDQVKNGDKRAAITGASCGTAYATAKKELAEQNQEKETFEYE